MFIIEWILKKIIKPEQDVYEDVEESSDVDASVTCKHVFMPVDSTGEVLSCINCGLLRKKDQLDVKNFFDDESNYLNEE